MKEITMPGTTAMSGAVALGLFVAAAAALEFRLRRVGDSLIAAGVLALVAALATACGSAQPPAAPAPSNQPSPAPAAAWAYLKAHPVPGRPGMTAGIVLAWNGTDVPRGSPDPTGEVITLTVLTADGAGDFREATITCGNVATSQGCDVPDGGKLGNLPGSYLYFRTSGVLAQPGDIQLITYQAVTAAAQARVSAGTARIVLTAAQAPTRKHHHPKPSPSPSASFRLPHLHVNLHGLSGLMPHHLTGTGVLIGAGVLGALWLWARSRRKRSPR